MAKYPTNPVPFTAVERNASGKAAVGRAGSMIDVEEGDATLPGKPLGAQMLNTLSSKDNGPARPLQTSTGMIAGQKKVPSRSVSSRSVRGRR